MFDHRRSSGVHRRSTHTSGVSWVGLWLILNAVNGVGTASAAAPTTIAITDVAIFVTATGQMSPGQTVLIKGDRIQEVGHHLELPEECEVVDGKGHYLIPGLIDAHVHLVHLSDRTHVAGEEFLPMFLGAGVTSVRSTGDGLEGQTRIAQHVNDHPERYPRVFLGSPMVDGDPPFHKDVGVAITANEQIEPLVDNLRLAGVTTLKLYVGMTRGIGKRVIEEAHKRGIVVTGHLGLYSAQDAVADGIDCLEHIWSVLDYVIPRGETRCTCNLDNPRAKQLIALLRDRGVAVDPTLVVFRNLVLLGDQPEYLGHSDNARTPGRMRLGWEQLLKERQFQPQSAELRREEFRKYQELTGMLYREGVMLLAGTDAPEPLVSPGFSMHQELELLVESGLPPAAAINCATINNARILRQDHNLGSIEPGKIADLILLSRNPLNDIRNTRSIAKVIRSGRVLEPKQILDAVPVE